MLSAIRPVRSSDSFVLLLGLGTAIALFADLALYVVLPTHTADAGILLVNVGLMLSANRLIRIFLNGPYGVLIERIPRRPVLLLSQGFGITAALMYVVTGFWPTLAGRLLWGAAWAGFWLAGNAAVLDISTDANRGRLVGRFHMWTFAGYVGGALFGGLLTDQFGYQTTFAVFACGGLLAGLMWFLFLPETRPSAAVAAQRTATSAPPPRIRAILAPLVTAIIITGLNWLIFLGMIGAVLALLLQDRVETPLVLGLLVVPLTTLTGFVAAGKDLLSLLAAPVSGRLSDHLGSRWMVIVPALGTGIIALLMLAFGDALLVVLGLLLGAVTTSILQTQTTALVGDYVGHNRRGRLLGIMITLGDMGAAAGPLLAFALIEQGWTLQNLFLTAALLLGAIFPWACWISWRYARVGQAIQPASA